MASEVPSSIGLALLALVGSSAGFLAASVPGGAADELGPMEPGQAHRIDPMPASFGLQAPDGPATLLIYDANGSFERSVSVDAGEQTRVQLSETRERIVLVPEASSPVRLAPHASSLPEVSSVPIGEDTRALANSNGGAVATDTTLQLERRPASLALAVEGKARDVDAIARTSQGPVLERLNGTAPANGTHGSTQLWAENLTDGTYRVSVQADRLVGRVLLVTRHLDLEQAVDPLDTPSEELDRLGAAVASLEKDEVWEVGVRGEGLTLAIEREAWARVNLYDDEHRLVRSLDVGRRGPSFDFSNGSSTPNYTAVRVDAPAGTYAVQVDKAGGEGNQTVWALLPGRDAAPRGQQLEVETDSLSIRYPDRPGQTTTRTVRYAGGLTDVRVDDGDGTATDREIVVDSPLGVVLRRSDTASMGGQDAGSERTVHVERFGPGPLEVHVDAEAGAGTAQVVYRHYIP